MIKTLGKSKLTVFIMSGLILGILEAIVAGYISSEYKDAVAFVVLLGILFFMPGGIFSNLKAQRV